MTIAVSRGSVRVVGKALHVDLDMDGSPENDVVIVFPVGVRIDPANMTKGTQFLVLEHGEGFLAIPDRWANAATTSEPVAKETDWNSVNDRVSALEFWATTHVHTLVTAGLVSSGPPAVVPSTSATFVGSNPLEVT